MLSLAVKTGVTQDVFLEPSIPYKGCQSPVLKEGNEIEHNVMSIPPVGWPFSSRPVGKPALFPEAPSHPDVVFCVSQLAQILPTEENFLLCFRQHVGSSAEFMEVSFLCSRGPTFLLYS